MREEIKGLQPILVVTAESSTINTVFLGLDIFLSRLLTAIITTIHHETDNES